MELKRTVVDSKWQVVHYKATQSQYQYIILTNKIGYTVICFSSHLYCLNPNVYK
jgi:hypothetical protein